MTLSEEPLNAVEVYLREQFQNPPSPEADVTEYRTALWLTSIGGLTRPEIERLTFAEALLDELHIRVHGRWGLRLVPVTGFVRREIYRLVPNGPFETEPIFAAIPPENRSRMDDYIAMLHDNLRLCLADARIPARTIDAFFGLRPAPLPFSERVEQTLFARERRLVWRSKW